jgi:hypothetical protein
LKFPGTPNEDIFDCHNCGGAMYSVGREFWHRNTGQSPTAKNYLPPNATGAIVDEPRAFLPLLPLRPPPPSILNQLMPSMLSYNVEFSFPFMIFRSCQQKENANVFAELLPTRQHTCYFLLLSCLIHSHQILPKSYHVPGTLCTLLWSGGYQLDFEAIAL